MDAAAGAGIKARHLHNANRPGQLPLGTVKHMGQLFLSGIPAGDGQILPDGTIGLLLNFPQILRRNNTVEIDFDHLAAHVETHIMITVTAMDDAGDDMLTGMLLHQIKTAIIIEDSFHTASDFQGTFTQMDYFFATLLHISNANTAQSTQIAGLSAAFRIKRGCIQHNFITFCRRCAA